ncbi:hypothetical protein [Streptomyces sp. NPDC054849]
MIKNGRLGRGLIVAGTVAAALGGGVCSAQAVQAAAPAHAVLGDELPELGTPVAASGLTSGLDSISEASPILLSNAGLANAKQQIGKKDVDTLTKDITAGGVGKAFKAFETFT